MRASIPVLVSRAANQRAIKGFRSHRARRLPTPKKIAWMSQLPPKSAGIIARRAPTPKQAKMKPGVMTSRAKSMSAATSHSCHTGRREMNSGIIDSVLSKRGVVAKLAKLPYYS